MEIKAFKLLKHYKSTTQIDVIAPNQNFQSTTLLTLLVKADS